MSAQPRRHLSAYRHRIAAAQIASRLLMKKRDWDRVTQQILEAIVFQRDERVDVLDWVKRLATEVAA